MEPTNNTPDWISNPFFIKSQYHPKPFPFFPINNLFLFEVAKVLARDLWVSALSWLDRVGGSDNIPRAVVYFDAI